MMTYRVNESVWNTELDVEPTVAFKCTKTTGGAVTKDTFTGLHFIGNSGTIGAIEHSLFMQQQINVFKHLVPSMIEYDTVNTFMVCLVI